MRLEPSAAQDEPLRELLGRFPPIEGVDLERPLYAQMVERLDELLAAEGAGVSWAGDVAPWFDGHVAMALTDLPASRDGGPGRSDGHAGGAAVRRPARRDRCDRRRGRPSIGSWRRRATLRDLHRNAASRDFTIRSSTGSDGGAYALTDDQLVVRHPTPTRVRAALDTQAAGAGTLAEMAEITRLTDALPDRLAGFFVLST